MEGQTDRSDVAAFAADYLRGLEAGRHDSVVQARSGAVGALGDGTVTRTMILCALLLDSRLRSMQVSVRSLAENLVVVNGTILWKGLRVSILGLPDEQALYPKKVLPSIDRACSNSVALCVLPSPYIERWQEISDSLAVRGRRVIPIFPADAIALAAGDCTVSDLFDFKLYRATTFSKLDSESQFERTIFEEFAQARAKPAGTLYREVDQAIQELQDQQNWIEHPRLNQVMQVVREKTDCLIVGPSSSGKSTLAFEAATRLRSAGYSIKYIDVGSLPAATASVAFSSLLDLLEVHHGQTLIIMDDLQSGPAIAHYILTLLDLFRHAAVFSRPPVLALTWPSYASDAARWFSQARVIRIQSRVIRTALLERRPSLKASVADLESVAGDDLLLWRLLIDDPVPDLTLLNRSGLAEQLWLRRTKDYTGDLSAAKRAVFLASTLGKYELEVTEGFVSFECSIRPEDMSGLFTSKLLRRNGEKISAGHRSLCTLLADWLARDPDVRQYFARLHAGQQAADLVLAYIRSLDGTEIWPVLHTLYSQVGFKGALGTKQRAQSLTGFWQAIEALVERIEQQTAADPTWGNTLSSALFAIEALSDVGKRDRARESIEFMRSHWRLAGDTLYVLGGTTERLDFDQIARTMLAEDTTMGLRSVPGRQSASDVDMDRFHQTWVAGLILCAEEAYGELTRSDLQKIAITVERLQSPQGYFYPRRVPWCTARVLTGLARCGRTYYNSQAVRKACDWLLAPTSEGGSNDGGVWRSGTGAWNTTLLTTVMCATALVTCGIDPDDQRLATATRFLSDSRPDWTKTDKTTDGALSVEAYLLLGGSWREIVTEIGTLFQQARREAFWGMATVSAAESFEESCRVATIASYLTRATWESLKAELPEFLDAFAVPDLAPVDSEEQREIGRALLDRAEVALSNSPLAGLMRSLRNLLRT